MSTPLTESEVASQHASLALALDVALEVDLAAPIARVFRAVTRELHAWFTPSGRPQMRMTLEPWVGGRLWRDLGEEGGHLWGTVQVIRPPRLLEIAGPMFVSAPSLSHLMFRLHEADAARTRLEFRHQAVGVIPEEMRHSVREGWTSTLTQELKAHVERNH